MAAVPGVAFDRTGFEAGIRQAMQMGLPAAVADQPVFHFSTSNAVTGSADGRGVPFSPTATVSTSTPAPVSGIVCGITFGNRGDVETRLGDLSEDALAITLLDAEYQQVSGCSYVVLGGDRYDYASTDAPVSLFTAPVWTVRFTQRGGKVSTQ